MENTNDKNKDFEHNRRMAEIREKYEKKNKKKLRPLKWVIEFLRNL